MYSPTSTKSRAAGLAQRANLRLQFFRWLSGAAVAVGLLVSIYFIWQSGFFNVFLAKREGPIEILQKPDVINSTGSLISGFDQNQMPYKISAAQAVQDVQDSRLVHMNIVEGHFQQRDGGAVNLTAATALYDTKSKKISLAGQVVFEQAGRYQVFLDKADVNLDSKDLVSQSPVRVEMTNGKVEADNLQILENGAHVIFTGHVKTRFDTQMGNGDEQ